MEIEIMHEDLDEIESRYDALASWLTRTFASPISVMFVLQSVMDAVDQARATLAEDNED